ncbi:MAG: hypothetical protein EXS58_06785 [Candidatus Latescibacteria bacterium]|nr:hypothetical protein [Candidatus Latescibacterota bacterium]
MIRNLLLLLLSLTLCAFLNFLGVRGYVLLDHYSGFADHFNTVGVVFLLFWVTLIGLLLRPWWTLSPSSFALIYATLMVATVIPTMGFGGYFIPLIAGVFYYATPENDWSNLLWDHIPDWAAPRDLQAVRGLFEGIGADQPIPWGLWTTPLILWGLFMFAFYLVSLGCISLVHHQWSREERLVYPLAVVPTLMVESFDQPSQSFLRSKLLWAGFFIAWSMPTINMLDRIFDFQFIDYVGIPATSIYIRQLNLNYTIYTDLLTVGLSFLVNLNVLFSVWFFHLLVSLEEGLLGYAGISLPLPTQPHGAGSVLLANQQIGSLLFLVVSSLWISRDFLRRQWQLIAGQEQHDHGNLLSPRLSALLGLIGLLYMAGFLWATGLNLGWALLFLLVGLLVFLGTARLLAQTGIGRLRAAYSIPPLLTNNLGSTAFGSQGLAAMGLSFVWSADIQLFLMGTLAHAFRVCEDTRLKISSRKLLLFLTASVIVSLATTILCYIWIGYRKGLIHGFVWYYVMSPNYHWGWVVNTINNPYPPQYLATFFLILGAGLAALLSFANHHLAGWPLHPVGLAVALTNTVSGDWFGMFLAWLIKNLALRYGGIVLYRQLRPFFVGLILGSCVGLGGAELVYTFYYI